MARGSLLVLALAVVLAAPAGAAYPGANGRIAFVRWLEDERLAATSDFGSIWTVRPDGSGERRLTRTRFGDSDPVWSPDGRRIAFVRRFADDVSFPERDSELMVMNADGSRLRRLTRNAVPERSPAWSRDGRRLFFVRVVSDSDRPAADVWVMTLATQRARRVLRTPELELEVAISARGDQLAYTAAWPERTLSPPLGYVQWEVPEHRELWTVRVDGRQRRPTGVTSATFRPPLVLGESLSAPTWTPGGRIAFASWGRVVSIRPDGEGEQVHGNGSAVAWSPNDAEIATSRGDAENGAFIYVLRALGGTERRVTTDTFATERAFDLDPDWQPLRRR